VRAVPKTSEERRLKSDHPSLQGYAAAAWLLDCEPAAIQAVARVEAGTEGAFLPTDEPVILFERHLFRRFTEGRYDARRVPGVKPEHAILSSSSRGGYGPYSIQHKKLQAAVLLDKQAAQRACSWGLFQILGDNHQEAGYPILQEFINAMYNDVEDHLRAFTGFIRYDARKVKAIRAKDWATFARLYNGPAYAENQYDVKMARAYTIISGDVRHA
jgi:hypothetical protein